jgi:hypothetical protein
VTATYSISFEGARDAPSARRPFPERLPPLPRVAGRQHELHDVAARRGDAKNLASEKRSLRLCPFVCFEALNFFE